VGNVLLAGLSGGAAKNTNAARPQQKAVSISRQLCIPK
jgi:hypothetical protein